MPKTKVDVDVDGNVPLWDDLVNELGDPRPYEAAVIGAVTVTDEPCVDHDGFVDAYDALDEHVYGYALVVDTLQAEAREELDEQLDAATATVAELFAQSSHSLAGVQQPVAGEPSPPPSDPTVLASVSGVLDILNQSADSTQELPACPSS